MDISTISKNANMLLKNNVYINILNVLITIKYFYKSKNTSKNLLT